jgi:Major Facilitator Superfamily
MTAEPLTPSLPLERRAGALTFAAIFSLESFVRSLNATVVSLQAYALLGSSQRVSIATTCVSMSVFLTTLFLPYGLGRLRRRWAYTLGAGAMMAACLGLASYTVLGQLAGMYLRNIGAAILNITLQLYILDHIRRTELARTEPIRLSLSTVSWMAGPFTGVWLHERYGPVATQLASFTAACVLLSVFWWLRLSDRTTLPQGTMAPFNPLANLRRFVSQPRLRLAWTIAFGRSCFWSTLFIYGPILFVEAGRGQRFAGVLISLSQAVLFAAYGFGALARRWGVRRVIAGCFAGAAASAIGAGLSGTTYPILAAGLLLIGSLAASGLDGVGGIPFLRAVRPHDRQRMAAVYRTFIDFSELIPGFVFAVALLFFDIQIVFIILGLALAAIGTLSWRYLPRSM